MADEEEFLLTEEEYSIKIKKGDKRNEITKNEN